MPWCEDCSKFWTPTSMPPDGTCLTCHRIIAEPPDTRVPWHFWLLLGALVVYLAWRLVQGIEWLAAHDQPVAAVALAVVAVALIAGAAAWKWWPVSGSEDAAGPGAGPGGASTR